jgi:hypothetical protein
MKVVDAVSGHPREGIASMDIRCSECGTVILNATPADDPNDREPCPECGSAARTIPVHVQSALELRSKLSLKQRRLGLKKPILESIFGDDLFRLTNKWNHLLQIIDRLHDRYYKLIVDPATGEVLLECDEPLSHHIGRGSAKLQKHNLDHEHIAIAAYFIWEKEGRLHGRDKQHWGMGIEQLKRARAGVPPTHH